SDPAVAVASWTWGEMTRALSPRLLAHAAERSFRGDRLLALSRAGTLLGIVWQARDERRAVVTGGRDDGTAAAVYYHPVAAGSARTDDLVAALRGAVADDGPLVLVTPRRLAGDGVSLRHTFRAGHD